MTPRATFTEGQKFHLSKSGRIVNKKYLDSLSAYMTDKTKRTQDTEKLLYKGREMTFTEFYD